MLRGERVGLRARHEADLPLLMDELYDDVATRSRADTRPWVPVSPEAKNQPYRVEDLPASVTCFSVVDLERDQLVGESLLWGIDTHNRLAHIGLSIRPAFRGQGLAVDIVRVLCHYGFVVRGLNRLQIDTLADNEAMRRAAVRAGFTLEATFRRAAWVTGEFVDEVAFGLLAHEWRP
ncbi:MAG: GNAT family N-acetyltransferase [Actinomycetota bacterium]|nr:GNAT family N-acetyltransferase [Actinomycetota bacterium]